MKENIMTKDQAGGVEYTAKSESKKQHKNSNDKNIEIINANANKNISINKGLHLLRENT